MITNSSIQDRVRKAFIGREGNCYNCKSIHKLEENDLINIVFTHDSQGGMTASFNVYLYDVWSFKHKCSVCNTVFSFCLTARRDDNLLDKVHPV